MLCILNFFSDPGTMEIPVTNVFCITGLHCVVSKINRVKLRFVSRGHPRFTLCISSGKTRK